MRHFSYMPYGWGIRNKKRAIYLKGVKDCLEYLERGAWHELNDPDEEYPDSGVPVLVEDVFGEKYIAICDANYNWVISNGEDCIDYLGKIYRWIELD